MAMKITIEQLDIEQAIKDHLGSMMDIKEGAHLDIDLSATRGSAGFTATITIRNADEVARGSVNTPTPSPVEEVVQTPNPTVKIDGRTKAAKALNILNRVVEEAQSTEVAEVTEVQETVNQVEEVETETAEVNVEVASENVEELATDANEQTEAPQRASLFSGLNKPKN